MEKSINSQMKITGVAESKGSITKFTNPIIEPVEVSPNFTIASIDIETGAKTNQLYSIAVHITGKKGEYKKVFMIGENQNVILNLFISLQMKEICLQTFLLGLKKLIPI